MPLKNKKSSKSPGAVMVPEPLHGISTTGADATASADRGIWASNARGEDLLIILDSAPFGIVVNKGETGELVYLNREALKIGGYTVSEVCDKQSAIKALTPERVDLEAKMDKLRRIEASGGGIYLDEIKSKDGYIKRIEMRAIVLPDKTRVAMWTDVTRREEAEAALREVNMDLENRIQKRTEELERSREELRFLSEHLQRAREEERLSIAREVHDELVQPLSVMKIDASFLGQNVPTNQGDLKKQTESLEEQIDGAILAVRNICTRLRPSVLMHFGLSATIEWYLEDIQKRTGLNCFVQIDVNVPIEETDLSLVLFRILQEAMTNIIRHAKATEVNVMLTADDNDLVMKIRDNGRGITSDRMQKPQSFGIIGIRERVRFWGGESTFEGAAGTGTTVTISIPLKRRLSLPGSRPNIEETDRKKAAAIKILVVDDHMIFREGIKKVLTVASDIMVSGEAGNGRETLALVSRNPYDVVLLELALPDIEGLELLRLIKNQKPRLPVLILSSFSEDQFALRMLKEGASGYLTKESVPNDLIYAIRKAAGGGKYISASLAESLAGSATGEKEKLPHELLSGRELEIFSMLAAGKSVKEMAYDLSLSRTSVASYRSRILQKLKFKSNTDLLRYAMEHRLV